MNGIGSIQNVSMIFSLALSADDELLACGGCESDVTVWNRSQGTIVSRLAGLKHQAHAVAFSPDSSMLAAANLWGGLCVWNVADGKLLEQKPETSSRKIRSLVFLKKRRALRLPVMLSESIHSQTGRILAPDGIALAVRFGAVNVRIQNYKTKVELDTLDFRKYEIAKSGARTMAWSSDSRALGLAGQGWAGRGGNREETDTDGLEGVHGSNS